MLHCGETTKTETVAFGDSLSYFSVLKRICFALTSLTSWCQQVKITADRIRSFTQGFFRNKIYVKVKSKCFGIDFTKLKCLSATEKKIQLFIGKNRFKHWFNEV